MYSMIPIQIRITRKLLEKIDKLVEEGIYACRSEAIRDAIRKHVNNKGDQMFSPSPNVPDPRTGGKPSEPISKEMQKFFSPSTGTEQE